MPWQECSKVDERLRFVARVLEGEKMAVLCRRIRTGALRRSARRSAACTARSACRRSAPCTRYSTGTTSLLGAASLVTTLRGRVCHGQRNRMICGAPSLHGSVAGVDPFGSNRPMIVDIRAFEVPSSNLPFLIYKSVEGGHFAL
jgi:hypothetical protein